MNNFFSTLASIWDPRPVLAKQWFEAAEKYEHPLGTHPSVNQQTVDLILAERNRIRDLGV